MDPRPRTTPKDFFLQLAALVTLYVSASSVITLLFQIINSAFPDALSYNYYGDPYSTGMRLAIASLIIIFPIHILLMWLIGRDLNASPEKRELSIRKWLTFFTLLGAGLAIMIDLVVLVHTFLGGEITTRFVLKVVAVLVVAGVAFGYYIYDIRRNWQEHKKGLKIFTSLTCLAVLLALVWGFVVLGSPSTARKMRFDAERISNLQNIQWQLVNYWQQKEELPAKLSDLDDSISSFRAPKDPVTQQEYGYEVTGTNTFKLCADFSLKSAGTDKTSASYPYVPEGVTNENWQHEKGTVCFDRTIDPKLYPPRKDI